MVTDPTTGARLDLPVEFQPSDQPVLCIVVDTEEEFDWSSSFSRKNTATTAAPKQAYAHEIFDPLGVKPMYVMDQAIVDSDTASDFFSTLHNNNHCEIGAHLHTWLSPPFEEEVNDKNSYQGNLSNDLEYAKIKHLRDSIKSRFNIAPTTFKAGRYGLGKNSFQILRDLGFKIDCSVVPYTNYRPVHGPDYRRLKPTPFWTDKEQNLLELPLTRGFVGWGSIAAPLFSNIIDAPLAHKLKLPAILSRSGMMKRLTLTPEGISAKSQKQLLLSEYKKGQRFFSLAYHSSSLGIGNTDYVKNKKELADFLNTLKSVLTFFKNELNGQFLSVNEIHKQALQQQKTIGQST